MGSFLKLRREAGDTGIVSVADAREMGISPRVLHYLCVQGRIRRVSRGFYDVRDEVELSLESLLKETLLQIGEAVVCLQSALQLYDLTDEVPEYLEFFAPRARVSRRKIDSVKIHSTRHPLTYLDTNIVSDIVVTSLEQTLVDMFRFGYPMSRVLEVIDLARRKQMAVKVGVIRRQADIFRAKGKIRLLLDGIL